MPRKSRKNAGLIGLGIIGTRVAAALRAGGYHVFVWNRTPRAEPNFLSSPAELAEVCDTIQLFVSDAEALFEVLDSFGDLLTPQHTIICSATVGPEATIEAAELVHKKGAKFLDAPFTGSKIAAEKRELVYYIGGEDETLKRVEPVLKASSKAIVKIGEIGQAAIVKVATNLMGALTVQALAEALAVVKKSGVPPEKMIAALENHGLRSGMIDMKLPGMIAGNFDTHFSMKHMFKDVQLGIHMANALALDIPATTATAGVMYGALNRGWADLDFSALVKVYDEPAEKEISSKPDETPADIPAAPAAAEEPQSSPEKLVEPPKESLASIVPPPPPPREELEARGVTAVSALPPEPLEKKEETTVSQPAAAPDEIPAVIEKKAEAAEKEPVAAAAKTAEQPADEMKFEEKVAAALKDEPKSDEAAASDSQEKEQSDSALKRFARWLGFGAGPQA